MVYLQFKHGLVNYYHRIAWFFGAPRFLDQREIPYESCKLMVPRWTISLARARLFLPPPLTESSSELVLTWHAPSSDLILIGTEPCHTVALSSRENRVSLVGVK